MGMTWFYFNNRKNTLQPQSMGYKIAGLDIEQVEGIYNNMSERKSGNRLEKT